MSEQYNGMSPNEQIEMMQRVRQEIADLRRVISVTQPKAQAYDLLEQVLGLLPRKGQGMSEDIDWMLKRKIDEIDKAMMQATLKREPAP